MPQVSSHGGGCHALLARLRIEQEFFLEILENISGGSTTRTEDMLIFSLGRYVSSRFCQLQNLPKQAELLLCAFPDVPHRCFGSVSKLVSMTFLQSAFNACGTYPLESDE